MAFKSETKDVSGGTGLKVVGNDPNAVNHQSNEIKDWLERSLLPRTLLKSTHGMQQAGEEFLFPHLLESDDAYKARLKSSTLLNAFKKTTSYLSGQVFQSDIILSEDCPEEFTEWIQSIDASGNSLDVFAKRSFSEGLGKGVTHILIDMPKKDPSIKTKKQEKEN